MMKTIKFFVGGLLAALCAAVFVILIASEIFQFLNSLSGEALKAILLMIGSGIGAVIGLRLLKDVINE